MKTFLKNNRISMASVFMMALMAFCIFLLFEKMQSLIVFDILSVLVLLLFLVTYRFSNNLDLYIRFAIYHLAISMSLVIFKAAASGSLVFFHDEIIHRWYGIVFVILIGLEVLFLLIALIYQRRKTAQSGTNTQNQHIELMQTQLVK